MKRIAKNFFLFLIAIYQSMAFMLGGKHCRFFPSCSEYATQAIQKHDVWKGVLLICKRLLVCHPFSKGGYDPVP